MKKYFIACITGLIGVAIVWYVFKEPALRMHPQPTHLTPSLIYERFTPLSTDEQGRKYGWLAIPEWNDSVYVRITPHKRGLSLAYFTPPDYTIVQDGKSYVIGHYYLDNNDWVYYWKSKQAVMESPNLPIIVPYIANNNFPLPFGHRYGWGTIEKGTGYIWDPLFPDNRAEFGGVDRVILDQAVPLHAIDSDKIQRWLKKHPGPGYSQEEVTELLSYIPAYYAHYLDEWIDDNARSKGTAKASQWKLIFNLIVESPGYYNDLYRLLGKLDEPVRLETASKDLMYS
jgi:hypothetical protein